MLSEINAVAGNTVNPKFHAHPLNVHYCEFIEVCNIWVFHSGCLQTLPCCEMKSVRNLSMFQNNLKQTEIYHHYTTCLSHPRR